MLRFIECDRPALTATRAAARPPRTEGRGRAADGGAEGADAPADTHPWHYLSGYNWTDDADDCLTALVGLA